MSQDAYAITNLNRVKRVPKRADYDKEAVYAVVDDALICHVGMIEGDSPVVIPTIHARQGNDILIHGATTSRMLNYIASGRDLCITVTHLDGIVLARSAMHHSMNYRSAVLYGKGMLIDDPDEKWEALRIFTEKLVPGRWEDARQPNAIEMKATAIVRVPIDLASAKVRIGPPVDDEADYALDVWAGVLPMRTVFGSFDADERLKEGVEIPAYLHAYAATKAG